MIVAFGINFEGTNHPLSVAETPTLRNPVSPVSYNATLGVQMIQAVTEGGSGETVGYPVIG